MALTFTRDEEKMDSQNTEYDFNEHLFQSLRKQHKIYFGIAVLMPIQASVLIYIKPNGNTTVNMTTSTIWIAVILFIDAISMVSIFFCYYQKSSLLFNKRFPIWSAYAVILFLNLICVLFNPGIDSLMLLIFISLILNSSIAFGFVRFFHILWIQIIVFIIYNIIIVVINGDEYNHSQLILYNVLNIFTFAIILKYSHNTETFYRDILIDKSSNYDSNTNPLQSSSTKDIFTRVTRLTSHRSSSRVEIADIVSHQINQAGIYSIYEIPSWYDKYDYILHGYRLGYKTHKSICKQSAFFDTKQNEWCNAWTSIIPGIIYFVIYIYFIAFMPSFFLNHSIFPTKIFIIFFGIAGVPLSISSAYAHTFHCISKEKTRRVWNVDYVIGIIYGSTSMSIMQVHVMFYCDHLIQAIFILLIIFIAISTILIVFKTSSTDSVLVEVREISMALIIILNFFLLPATHFILLFIDDNYNAPSTYSILILTTSITSIIMFVIRGMQYPEKYYVTKYIQTNYSADMYKIFCNDPSDSKIRNIMQDVAKKMKNHWSFYKFNSHAIFHVFVHSAAQLLFMSIAEFLKFRDKNKCGVL